MSAVGSDMKDIFGKMIKKERENGYSLMEVTIKGCSARTRFMEKASIIILRELSEEFGRQIY